MSAGKIYFLAPHFDFPPKGCFSLGSLIVDPLDPSTCLNAADVRPIESPPPWTTHKNNWKQTVRSVKDGRASIWARWVGLLGLGASIGGSFDDTISSHYSFNDLETTFFRPSQEYVEAAVQSKGVQSFIRASRFAVPIYMITGMKIVRGTSAEVTTERLKGREGHANAGNALGPSMTIHPDIGGSTRNVDATSFEGADDFVFAYRLQKVTCHETAAVKHGNYNAGAMMGLEDRKKSGQEVNIIGAVELAGIDGTAENFSNTEVTVVIDEDDDKECICINSQK